MGCVSATDVSVFLVDLSGAFLALCLGIRPRCSFCREADLLLLRTTFRFERRNRLGLLFGLLVRNTVRFERRNVLSLLGLLFGSTLGRKLLSVHRREALGLLFGSTLGLLVRFERTFERRKILSLHSREALGLHSREAIGLLFGSTLGLL